ncbi:MAG TPA: hypothetical protein VGG23_02995, partial [Acidimicrobiales bacterium]
NGNFAGGSYTIDQTAPGISITGQPSAETQSQSATFVFSASDPLAGGVSSGVARLDYQLDGGGFLPAVSPLSFSALLVGSHTLQLRAADNAGNSTVVSATWSIDQTASSIQSIVQATPAGTATNGAVAYTLTFSEPVTGVQLSDFKATTTGTAQGSVIQVVGSGAVYTVSVGGVAGNGTIALDLVNDGSIDDLAGNPLFTGGGGALAGPATLVDQTPPTATITAAPASQILDVPATFAFSGNDPIVGGVASGIDHFEVSFDGSPFAPAASPQTFSGLSEGDHTFRVRAVDVAGNIGAAVSDTFTVNDAAPSVVSIVRQSPAAALTNASAVSFTVTFNGDVTGVDPTDFAVVTAGTLTTSAPAVTGSGDSYVVTVDGVVGDGTVALDLVDDDSIVADLNGLPLGGPGVGNGDFAGQAFSIDQSGPVATFTAKPPTRDNDTAPTIAFSATDPVIAGVSSGVNHLEFSADGGPFQTASSPVTLRNRLAGDHTVAVRAVDNLGNVGPTASYAWTIDLIAPEVLSIDRLDPPTDATNAGSVAFEVTFSEPVTGVDPTDFAVPLSGVVVAGIPTVAGSGSVYTVTVPGVAGNGTLGLDLVDDDSIRDLAGNTLRPAAVSFQPQSTVSVGVGATELAAADFNGDGLPDLA